MGEQQYVVFKLAKELFGVGIEKISTIIEYESGIKPPQSGDYVDGVINLRGDTVVVVDLIKKMNLDANESSEGSRRIILYQSDDNKVGFIADEANQTVKISDDDIDSPGDILINESNRYIKGIAKVDDKIVTILDIERAIGI
jgi:purine-binding chemotaxis protein CheW